jgi:23S rRNA (uracil1939-C5)-methyltransferase
MSRSKKLSTIENLEITDVAAEGKALGKHNGVVIFVKYAMPGDVVDVKILKDKRRYMEGVILKFRKFSEKRTDPFCEHFGICGGCNWQHLPYEEQLKYKQKEVSENLARIGRVDIPAVEPALSSAMPKYYRNKLEFTFSTQRWLSRGEIDSGLPVDRDALGFHMPEKFDKILDIRNCYLQPDPSNEIRLFVKDLAKKSNLEFYNPYTHEGLMRNLIIRSNIEGEFMLLLSVSGYNETVGQLLQEVQAKFPRVVSVFYVINKKVNDSMNDLEPVLFYGNDHLIESIGSLKFRISPKSFFQTNSRQAFTLYRTALDFAGLTGNETVYDLYTGTGTIALFLAQHCRKVTGMDFVEEAVADARINAGLNNIANADFFSGDVAGMMQDEFIMANGKPDVIVTDPPRAGMHKDVIEGINRILPSRIVYVSCNSATQARDINMLSGYYDVEKVQPVDMFPQTYHIENVALLRKRNKPLERQDIPVAGSGFGGDVNISDDLM